VNDPFGAGKDEHADAQVNALSKFYPQLKTTIDRMNARSRAYSEPMIRGFLKPTIVRMIMTQARHDPDAVSAMNRLGLNPELRGLVTHQASNDDPDVLTVTSTLHVGVVNAFDTFRTQIGQEVALQDWFDSFERDDLIAESVNRLLRVQNVAAWQTDAVDTKIGVAKMRATGDEICSRYWQRIADDPAQEESSRTFFCACYGVATKGREFEAVRTAIQAAGKAADVLKLVHSSDGGNLPASITKEFRHVNADHATALQEVISRKTLAVREDVVSVVASIWKTMLFEQTLANGIVEDAVTQPLGAGTTAAGLVACERARGRPARGSVGSERPRLHGA